jgi:uncharacterized integral membrane protein
MKLRIVIGLVIIALAGVVALQNSTPVDLRFLFWSAVVDQVLLIPGVFLAGLVAGLLLAVGRSYGRRNR